jgi:hypothetical protein
MATKYTLRSALLLSALLLAPLAAAPRLILFIAGPKSHAPGEHEHPAGCALLAQHLASSGLDLKVAVSDGWPRDPAAVTEADALVIYGDGLQHHPAVGHLAALRAHHQAGKGLAVLHWALEPGEPELAQLLTDTLGGYFEAGWSVNPVWKMTAPALGRHPATRGVAAFEIEEEFYYHLRLRDDVVPLLQALPPLTSLGKDGPRSGNAAVRQALADRVPQTLAWVVENPNGSRGFGFTGGHFHRHWANAEFRRLVLNAIVWVAGVEVPTDGVASRTVATPASLTIDEAIARGDLADVKRHLAADPTALNHGRDRTRPPLSQAVLRNKTDIALLLIEAGANPDAPDASRRTPLHLAVERRNAPLVTALLKAGAKPSEGDKDGWTPLHHAAAKDLVDIATLLIAGGADPMALSKLGGTPLHEAAASGGAEMVRLLLAHGVDPALKSKENVTALDIAQKYQNQPAIDALTKR